MKNTLVTLGTLVLLAGCDKPAPPPAPEPAAATTQEAPVAAAPTPTAPVQQAAPGPQAARAPSPQPAYDDTRPVPEHPVYADYRPPLAQPRPIAAPWAPPPLLGEAVPPQPYPDAAWTGGYWVWRDQWVWAPGHWARPPRPDYRWVPPYYEHRNDRVVFVDGFWSAPGVSFVRPAATLSIALAVVGAGIAFGRPPIGPDGPFVPPPPGSRWGLIVPAPVGTSPYVVRGAPPIIAPGMRVTNNVNRVTNDVHNTTIVRNTTVVNNVTIEAPASATSNHQAVHAVVAPQSHLVAGLPATAGPSPQPPPRDHGASGRAPEPRPTEPRPTEPRPTEPRPLEPRPAELRPTEPSHAAPNATRPVSTDDAKRAPHGDVAAPATRQPGRPSESARPGDREPPHEAQRPPERPPAAPEARPRPTPPSRPEASHAAPPHDHRPADGQHPPARQPAPPPKDHPAAAHADQHDAKDAVKAHDRKDERRE